MANGDIEVQRLAAHAVANLAVNGERAPVQPTPKWPIDRPVPLCAGAADNRHDIVKTGGLAPLIALMGSSNMEVQRQSTKAIANLAVNGAPPPLPPCARAPSARPGLTACVPARWAWLSGEQDGDREGRGAPR
jgi:hypothetical protein